MKKFLLAPFLAAVAMFVLGAAFWMSPLPYQALGRLPDDSAAALALGQIFPATGTYLVPGAYLDEKLAGDLMQRGPIAEVHFLKEGRPPVEAGVMLTGLLHYFVIALILAFFLHRSAPALRGYGCVVGLSTCIGVLAAVFVCYTDSIWWHHPWGWATMRAIYTVLVFLVAGLVLGRFFRPAASR